MKAKPSRKELEAKIKEPEAKIARNQTHEDPLDQNGNFYSLCVESAQCGILVHDDKGKILIFNSQLERISGYHR